jgi:NADH dehydrogenase FAD-containing subunit
MAETSRIVIIGASFAGLGVAHRLLKEIPCIQVILINPSKTFYFPIAAPRILAKPDSFQSSQYLIPIENGFGAFSQDTFKFIRGTATNIDARKKSVIIDDEKVIQFEYLVIASGSTTASTSTTTGIPIPLKQSNHDNMQLIIENAQSTIASATDIVIGGAGPIGVEFAGEIAEAMNARGKEARITLISSAKRVLPMLQPASGAAAEHILSKLNVTVVKERRVTSVSRKVEQGREYEIVTLDNGEELIADLYIPTTGVTPNNSFIPPAWLDKDGWLMVDNELRVVGLGAESQLPIYAAGDITNNSKRLSYKAVEQATVVSANLKNEILGGGRRRSYNQGDSIMMVVPVGSQCGTGQIYSWTPWSCFVKFVKGKDFLISKGASAVMS